MRDTTLLAVALVAMFGPMVDDGAADSAGNGAQRLPKVLMSSATDFGGDATPQAPMIMISQSDAAANAKAKSCIAYHRIYPDGSTTRCSVRPGPGIELVNRSAALGPP